MGGSRPLRNERGFTLVEVLASLTIMALISVTLIGYFVAAIDRSAEESRRVIAINLARLKAAELRDMAKQTTQDGSTWYRKLREALPEAPKIFTQDDPGLFGPLLDSVEILGTTYRYQVTLYRDEGEPGSHTEWLDGVMGENADKYLMRMILRVSWDDAASAPSPGKSVVLDTSLIDRR
ncbi:MAG TPA: type II secretion system protein [Paenibacillaceae bacterium]